MYIETGYTAALAGIVDTKKAGLIYKIQVGNGNNDLLSSFIGSQSHAVLILIRNSIKHHMVY